MSALASFGPKQFRLLVFEEQAWIGLEFKKTPTRGLYMYKSLIFNPRCHLSLSGSDPLCM